MNLPLDFIPRKPFPSFKWKWASVQCTEGINDPVVLLGVLFRMRRLELLRRGLKYSSKEFAEELRSLSRDLEGRGVGVDLARRTGERNLIRNSGQYWSAVGLIPRPKNGVIELTPFGRLVADRKISQTEFAAITIRTFCLPNVAIQSSEECALWKQSGISLHPLRLVLEIVRALWNESGGGYITRDELLKIVVPLSGCRQTTIEDYVRFIWAFRGGKIDIAAWPDCCTSANDHRIGREYLLFLSNYGYLVREDNGGRERFAYNDLLDHEIESLLTLPSKDGYAEFLQNLQKTDVVSEIERKRVQSLRRRPNQARFRRDVLGTSPRCVITNVTMPEVLEAAHIIPYKYHGEDTRANGFPMRMDIHQLFDSGHLRIHENGSVFLTDRARMDYGATIPPSIRFPDWVNRDFVRWRWENYNGM